MARIWISQGTQVHDAVCRLDVGDVDDADDEPYDGFEDDVLTTPAHPPSSRASVPVAVARAAARAAVAAVAARASAPLDLAELSRRYRARTGREAPAPVAPQRAPHSRPEPVVPRIAAAPEPEELDLDEPSGDVETRLYVPRSEQPTPVRAPPRLGGFPAPRLTRAPPAAVSHPQWADPRWSEPRWSEPRWSDPGHVRYDELTGSIEPHTPATGIPSRRRGAGLGVLLLAAATVTVVAGTAFACGALAVVLR